MTVTYEPNAPTGPIGATERFFPIQWNLQAIKAPEAWATGQQGRGARVAVLDAGICDQHVEIAPNLDARRSASFVPGVPFNFDNDASNFWHGTHVAGIVAGADGNDNLGTVGVAPEATIIGVKVLDRGSGSFGGIIEGIIYAADPIKEGGAGADIINMSLGATFANSADANTQALIAAINQATTYAWSRGVLIIASAGNGDNAGHGINFDNGNYVDSPPSRLTSSRCQRWRPRVTRSARRTSIYWRRTSITACRSSTSPARWRYLAGGTQRAERAVHPRYQPGAAALAVEQHHPGVPLVRCGREQLQGDDHPECLLRVGHQHGRSRRSWCRRADRQQARPDRPRRSRRQARGVGR